MAGLNGTFGRRLSAVEDLLPPPQLVVDQQALDRAEWLSLAPMPALDYLVSVAEADPNRIEPHLIADIVIEAVWEADAYAAPSALEYVQARVLDKAVFTLSWALAGRSWNYGHHFEAIRLLLGDDTLTLLTPEQYLERWRATSTPRCTDDILARAGLFEPELHLLDAQDEGD